MAVANKRSKPARQVARGRERSRATPSHEIDDCHHDELERDDYLQWNRNALMLTPLVLEIIAEKAA
jgi:hypothetical protein